MQSVRKLGLDAELKQLAELMHLLETKGDYTVEELAELYASNSFNGYFFSFVNFVIKNLKTDNRQKTATILQTAKTSFQNFLGGQDISLDKIDNDLVQKYENHLKHKAITKNTISCYMRALRSAYNQAVKRGLTIQRNPFESVFTRIDKAVKRAVSEAIIIQLKNMNLSAHKQLAFARDLFMFSFYMRGISFVDMANLRKSNVKIRIENEQKIKENPLAVASFVLVVLVTLTVIITALAMSMPAQLSHWRYETAAIIMIVVISVAFISFIQLSQVF